MLPIPVEIERKDLPPELIEAVHALNGPRPREFTVTLVSAWAVIFASIWAAEWIDAWWATLLAIVVIATRMNILALLTHDQVHLSGYRHHYGDLLVNLFCAYPLLVFTVQDYAQVHLAHHRDYFTDADPDHLRKSGPEWTFPKSRRELAKIFLGDLLGLNFIKLIKGKRSRRIDQRLVRRGFHQAWVRPVYLLLIVAVLVATDTWQLALLYWIVPLFTVMQLIIRWGAICEHEYNRPGASVVQTTPLIELKWWERILLPNLNFSLHIYHHYFPGVAFSRLGEVHRMFREAGLVKDEAVFDGYGDFLRRAILAPTRA